MSRTKTHQSLSVEMRDEATGARIEVVVLAPVKDEALAKHMVELIRHLQAEAEKELNRIKALAGL